jgi:rhodanese-related sulfurtransferase
MSDVTLDDFAAAHITGTAQVVDVREPAEYLAGHVSDAASIPMGELPDRLAEIDRSKPVFVVCQSGGRSAAMTDVLLHHGFDAHSVTGGTAAWTKAGRLVDTGARERK